MAYGPSEGHKQIHDGKGFVRGQSQKKGRETWLGCDTLAVLTAWLLMQEKSKIRIIQNIILRLRLAEADVSPSLILISPASLVEQAGTLTFMLPISILCKPCIKKSLSESLSTRLTSWNYLDLLVLTLTFLNISVKTL